MALTRYEASDNVANSRKNPSEAWRRLQKRYEPTTGGRRTKPSAHDHFFWTVLSSGTPSGDRTLGVLHVSRYEKKMKDKLDDEIKLAGLEALVPEELEKHSDTQLESLANIRGGAPGNRLTYGEAKFGLRICGSKLGDDTGSRGHSDLMDVDAINSLCILAKEVGSSSPRDGCFKCGGALTFNETAMFTTLHAEALASYRVAKANRASRGPRVLAKARVSKGRERSRRNSPKANPKVPKVRTRIKPSKTGLSGF